MNRSAEERMWRRVAAFRGGTCDDPFKVYEADAVLVTRSDY
jgi:hypothetical protein